MSSKQLLFQTKWSRLCLFSRGFEKEQALLSNASADTLSHQRWILGIPFALMTSSCSYSVHSALGPANERQGSAQPCFFLRVSPPRLNQQ